MEYAINLTPVPKTQKTRDEPQMSGRIPQFYPTNPPSAHLPESFFLTYNTSLWQESRHERPGVYGPSILVELGGQWSVNASALRYIFFIFVAYTTSRGLPPPLIVFAQRVGRMTRTVVSFGHLERL